MKSFESFHIKIKWKLGISQTFCSLIKAKLLLPLCSQQTHKILLLFYCRCFPCATFFVVIAQKPIHFMVSWRSCLFMQNFSDFMLFYDKKNRDSLELFCCALELRNFTRLKINWCRRSDENFPSPSIEFRAKNFVRNYHK